MSKLNWSKARKLAQAMRHGGFEHATDVHSAVHADQEGIQKLQQPVSGVFSQTHPAPPKPKKKKKRKKACSPAALQQAIAPPSKSQLRKQGKQEHARRLRNALGLANTE